MGSCCTKDVLENATMENTEAFSLNGVKCFTKIIEVYDGDTVTLAFPFAGGVYKKRCRIEGVDCAEIRTKNLDEKKVGFEAKDFLSGFVLNKKVWTEFIEDKNDKFGRLLAIIHYNGTTLDKTMIEHHFGYEYHGGKKIPFEEWYY